MMEESSQGKPPIKDNDQIDGSNSKKTPTGGTTSMLRQNSNSSINSLPPITNAATSPNSSSEHSNSGSNISNVSHTNETNTMNATEGQDLNCNEKPMKKSLSSSGGSGCGSIGAPKDDPGAASNEKGKNSLKNASNSASTLCSLNLKEETITGGVLNVKKEENSLSPVSPVGFDVELNAAGRGLTTGKLGDLSASVGNKSNKNNSNNTEKSIHSPASDLSSKDDMMNGNNSTAGGISSGNGNVNASTLQQHQQAFGSNSIGNCLEYVQQQNHIFIFSTQLANKGAESVLNGQFQTIIAYHCTQPTTKNFLEEFFTKNPMKMSKLPRNMINMAHGGGVGGLNSNNGQWLNAGGLGGVIGGPKIPPKASNNKSMNFNLLNSVNAEQKPGRNMMAGFPEACVDDPAADLMHWEQSRGSTSTTPNELKIGDAIEQQQHKSNLGSAGGSIIDSKLDQIPSLQGVKVPDENLTPQQRQHREEQLAKLKKMNQIFFPESSDSSAPPQQTTPQTPNKLTPNDSSMPPSSMSNLLMNIGGQPGAGGVANLNQLNPALRHNMMQAQQKQQIQSQQPTTSNLCESDAMSNVLIGSGGTNDPQLSLDKNLGCETSNANMMNQNAAGIITSASDSGLPSTNNGSGFNQCGRDEKLLLNCPQDVNPIDWPKLQHQYGLDERLKTGSGKSNDNIAMNRLNSGSVSGMFSNLRPSNLSQNAANCGSNSQQRVVQGPPPPYQHPTQRSASVPIATQSPNPASPNNPTSNLSLPSPASSSTAGTNQAAATGVAGVLTNSPNMDTTPSTPQLSNKNSFSQESSSPANRNRSSHNQQLNSNPGTPLAHLSPKDLDGFSSATNSGPDNQQGNLDARFSAVSPNFPNFPAHMQNVVGGPINNYKTQLDRQQSTGLSAHFGRRADNLPLNPHSNRSTQNKLSGGGSFDPISSLAQMSQQLTSCSSSSNNVGGGGNNPIGGNNDLNISSNIGPNHHQNMDVMLQNMEVAGNMMETGGNLPSPMGIAGPNNCNINSMIMGGNMNVVQQQQRLMHPKMGPSFNSSVNNNSPAGNFHGLIPPPHHQQHRLRMPGGGGGGGMGFGGNFGNVSPNIQVKASTPNTIQYMPVRPQNNNNMRAPPSLDFLQRYANPMQMGGPNQMIENHGGNHLVGHLNAAPGNPDGNKMMNNLGNAAAGGGGNFFPHCNQLGEDELSGGNMGGMLTGPSHEVNMSMMRGLRPMMRQHSGMMGPAPSGVPHGPRMLAPNNIMQPFSNSQNNPDHQLDNDVGNLFASGPGNNASQMFPQMPGSGTHNNNNNNKANKSNALSMGGAGGVGAVNNSNLCSNLMPSDQCNAMPSTMGQSSAMQAMTSGNMPNVNTGPPIGPGGPSSGNMNYKPFVGPSSNDLKYAQQYHSFQQQLYATSTRSQQQQNGNNNNLNMASASNMVAPTNAPFFVNK